MPLFKSLTASLFRARGIPLPPDWKAGAVDKALFVAAGSEQTLVALLGAVRGRCEATWFAALADAGAAPLRGFGETYRLPRSIAGRLRLAWRLRRLRLDLCFVPMTGEGGSWLKAVAFLAGPRTLLLCPTPEHRFRYRPVSQALRRPGRLALRMLMAPATVVVVGVCAAYVLVRARVRRGAGRRPRHDQSEGQSRLKA